jgi:hypothetical protein
LWFWQVIFLVWNFLMIFEKHLLTILLAKNFSIPNWFSCQDFLEDTLIVNCAPDRIFTRSAMSHDAPAGNLLTPADRKLSGWNEKCRFFPGPDSPAVFMSSANPWFPFSAVQTPLPPSQLTLRGPAGGHFPPAWAALGKAGRGWGKKGGSWDPWPSPAPMPLPGRKGCGFGRSWNRGP